MKEILIRIGCVLLGVVLTLSTMKIGDFVKARTDSETVLVEEMPITEASITNLTEEVIVEENVLLYSDFEAEAEERYKELQEKENISAAEAEPELAIEPESGETDDSRKIKWIKDYPQVNSTKTLEEKMAERSSYEETLATNAFDKKVIENSTIDFSDVKITILGDSITAATNLDEEEQLKYAYPVLLEEILGCKEVVNLGKGGSAISRVGHYPMVERWENIPKDSDIIIVFGGTNDCLFENKWEFGHIEYDLRMNEKTFCGDLDEMASGMKYVYKDHNEGKEVKFLYINPPSTILNDSVYAMDTGNMVHQKTFAEAINTIVPPYGFEVIDLYNNNILNSHDKDVNAQFVPDGVHCSPEGYRILAEHIASQIIQRIEQ